MLDQQTIYRAIIKGALDNWNHEEHNTPCVNSEFTDKYAFNLKRIHRIQVPMDTCTFTTISNSEFDGCFYGVLISNIKYTHKSDRMQKILSVTQAYILILSSLHYTH